MLNSKLYFNPWEPSLAFAKNKFIITKRLNYFRIFLAATALAIMWSSSLLTLIELMFYKLNVHLLGLQIVGQESYPFTDLFKEIGLIIVCGLYVVLLFKTMAYVKSTMYTALTQQPNTAGNQNQTSGSKALLSVLTVGCVGLFLFSHLTDNPPPEKVTYKALYEETIAHHNYIKAPLITNNDFHTELIKALPELIKKNRAYTLKNPQIYKCLITDNPCKISSIKSNNDYAFYLNFPSLTTYKDFALKEDQAGKKNLLMVPFKSKTLLAICIGVVLSYILFKKHIQLKVANQS